MKPLQIIQTNAARSERPTLSLSEGSDPRVVVGAIAARDVGIANLILVGNADAVATELKSQGTTDGNGISIHDPATSPLTADLATAFHALRRHKGVDEDAARKAVETPLIYAAMLVREGHAAGTVGGAITASSHVLRTALQVIGKAPDAAMVSSFFLMYPPETAMGDARAMLYSDCGMVIDPSSDELAAIAAASAKSCRALLQQEPKIAMLSFSSKGSAQHVKVTKVLDALTRLKVDHPELMADAELQFDTAFAPSIGALKAPGSTVSGQANVMIFPNLDAGNIAYKITQRLGGYTAIGPILQGLAKPANDLSRGCVADDVTQMIAVTVLQSMAAQC